MYKELGMFNLNKTEGMKKGGCKEPSCFSDIQWQDHGHKTETEEGPS